MCLSSNYISQHWCRNNKNTLSNSGNCKFFHQFPRTIKWRGSSHKGKVAVSVTASHWCMQGELCGTHFTHKGGAANHLSRSRLSQLPIWSSRVELCVWIWLISRITETVSQCSLRSVVCFNKGGSHNDLNTVSIYMDPGVLWLPHVRYKYMVWPLLHHL